MKLHALTTSMILSVSAMAQSVVHIDSTSPGCGGGPAVLSDGSLASASATFAYDAATAKLTIVVENTSPVLPGEPSSTITRIYFNAPENTVSDAVLLHQVAPSTGQPEFRLGFDADPGRTGGNRAACFGNFNFRLAAPSFNRGIANPATEGICGLKEAAWLLGPVTFTLQLFGPEVHNLSSETFAAASSHNAPERQVNVAMKFDGSDCDGSATIGNDDLCRTAVFLRGSPNIGEQFQICVIGKDGCSAQLGASGIAGPTFFKNMTVPIGVPLIMSMDLGWFIPPTTELCMSVHVPLDQAMIGLTIYLANMTSPFSRPDIFGFSPAYEFTVGGLQLER